MSDYSSPECQKVPCFLVVFCHHRSPPVSLLGTIPTVIPIPGTCAMKREGAVCATLSITVRIDENRRPWAHSPDYSQPTVKRVMGERHTLRTSNNDRIAHRNGYHPAQHDRYHRVYMGIHPSSIRSFLTLSHGERSNSAQRDIPLTTLLTVLRGREALTQGFFSLLSPGHPPCTTVHQSGHADSGVADQECTGCIQGGIIGYIHPGSMATMYRRAYIPGYIHPVYHPMHPVHPEVYTLCTPWVYHCCAPSVTPWVYHRCAPSAQRASQSPIFRRNLCAECASLSLF